MSEETLLSYFLPPDSSEDKNEEVAEKKSSEEQTSEDNSAKSRKGRKTAKRHSLAKQPIDDETQKDTEKEETQETDSAPQIKVKKGSWGRGETAPRRKKRKTAKTDEQSETTTQTSLVIPKSLHQRMRVYTAMADEKIYMVDVIVEAVDAYLKERGY